MNTAADNVGPLELATTPEQQARIDERRELMRRAALSTIDMAARGLPVDRDYLNHCREFVRLNPPLQRPLGTGEPTRCHP